MNRNLLIIEDDPDIRKLIAMYFRRENFRIFEAENGEDGIRTLDGEKIQLIILDIMLSGMDGFAVCEYIRKNNDVPIIMLTARTQEEDKLRGYEFGADEYVTKPFSPKVLVAGAKALLSRIEGKPNGGDVFSCDGLIVNQKNGKVMIDEEKIELTRKEFDLLTYLMQNKGLILSKESILNHVWGYDYYGDPRTLDTHINRLREKLKDKSRLIKTVRGRGYCFENENHNQK
jgi:DNA-binding response OmpR family regulator